MRMWRFHFTLVGLLISILLQGCGTIYLYDESREKLAKQAVVSFEEANTAALFDRAANDLGDHLKAQRASVRRMAIAAQDVHLVALIEGVDVAKLQGGDSAMEPLLAPLQLEALITIRMNALVGTDAADAIVKKSDLDVIRVIQKSQASRIVTDTLSIAALRKSYKELANGTATNTCMQPIKEPMNINPPSVDPADAKALYPIVLKACQDLAKLKEQEMSNRAFGLDLKNLTGDYEIVTEELLNLKIAKEMLVTTKKELTVELKRLEKAYKEAAKANPTIEKYQENLTKAAKDITDFVKDLQKGDKLVAKVKELTNSAIDLSAIEKVTKVPSIFIGEQLSANILETNLTELLNQAVDPKKEPTTPEGKRARSFILLTVRAVDTLARLDDGINEPSKVPSPNALLISLAYQRYRQEVAIVSEAQLEGHIKAKSLEEKALMEEIFHLWSAYQAAKAMKLHPCGRTAMGFSEYVTLCKNNRKAEVVAAKALVSYDQAWSRGLVDRNTASIASSGLTQQFAVEKARQNATVWFELLKPALQELVAYGEGGIKRETIANLIQALGFATIAAGVY